METLNCLLQREDDSWEAIWPLQEAAPHDCTDDHRLEKHTHTLTKNKFSLKYKRESRKWWLPILVSVIEVLVGVLDLTHFSRSLKLFATTRSLKTSDL